MSGFRRQASEKGMALVLAMMITAAVGLLIAALSITISSYLKNLAIAREKNQGYYAAVAGSEELRNYLWRNSCAPPSWCGTLLAANANDSTYQNRTTIMALNGQTSFSTTGYLWNLYLKDNDDGDNNYSNDNDGIILASVMAKDPRNNTTTTIEAMFIFNANNGIYAQLGGAPDRSGYVQNSGSGTNSGNVVQTTQ